MAAPALINPNPPKPTEKEGEVIKSDWWGGTAFPISQIFGVIEDLIVNGVHIHQMHTGIDVKMPVGTPIYNPVHAKVIGVGVDNYGAKFLKLLMDNGNEVLLWHLNDITVAMNQDLPAGTVIAHSGNTGLSSAPHLHFEVNTGGKPIDPFSWLMVSMDPNALVNKPSDVGPLGNIFNIQVPGLSQAGDFFGHLNNPGHDPCSPPPSEVGFFRVIDAVGCPSNWWKVGFTALGFVMIGIGIFIYFIKEEKQAVTEATHEAESAAVVAA